MNPAHYLPRLFRPPVYQGSRHSERYFEGWYFKFVDKAGENIWSVIPGVSFSGDSHSFIQAIHAGTGNSHYIRFPLEAFSYDRKELLVQIGPNRFTGERVTLDLREDQFQMRGELQLRHPHPFPVTLTAPGIMGWYSYVPFMECYHGVVSMQHGISGSLTVNGSEIDFEGGKGYIEKDWGRSMPSDWIWIQSNHFRQDPGASFMISLARIPWLRGHFPGFLSFLLVEGKLYRFATYNRSQVERVEVTSEQVSIELKQRKHRLKIEARIRDGGVLKAPRHGAMDREIRESIVSAVELELTGRDGEMIFADTGDYAGLEIVGRVEEYFQNND
jgi:tocopherol cyclase